MDCSGKVTIHPSLFPRGRYGRGVRAARAQSVFPLSCFQCDSMQERSVPEILLSDNCFLIV